MSHDSLVLARHLLHLGRGAFSPVPHVAAPVSPAPRGCRCWGDGSAGKPVPCAASAAAAVGTCPCLTAPPRLARPGAGHTGHPPTPCRGPASAGGKTIYPLPGIHVRLATAHSTQRFTSLGSAPHGPYQWQIMRARRQPMGFQVPISLPAHAVSHRYALGLRATKSENTAFESQDKRKRAKRSRKWRGAHLTKRFTPRS